MRPWRPISKSESARGTAKSDQRKIDKAANTTRKKPAKYPALTAERIQKYIHTRYIDGASEFFFPLFNKYYWKEWECDVLLFTKNRQTHEMEIKISPGDFFQDFKKEEKHNRFSRGHTNTPNQFSYVVPANMISVDKIPEYAGLIYCKENGSLEVIKKAPVLHQEQQDEQIYKDFLIQLAEKTNFKVFQR